MAPVLLLELEDETDDVTDAVAEDAAEDVAVDAEAEVEFDTLLATLDAAAAEDALLVEPSEPWEVKLVKPLAEAISATLRPSAVNDVASDVAEFVFSVSAPPTDGSTRGTMPRRAAVDGKVASEHSDGTDTVKGLKFFSAATSPAAAAKTSEVLPRVETMVSARVSCGWRVSSCPLLC